MEPNEAQRSMMDQFMARYCPFHKTDKDRNAVELHHALVGWLECNPQSSKVKFISFFPAGSRGQRNTKRVFKFYLDNILCFRRNTKTLGYWVKNKDDAKRLNDYFIERGLFKWA